MKKQIVAAGFCLLSGWSIGLSSVVAAAPNAEPQTHFLDRSREGMRALTESVARKVDSWFGDKPFEQGGRVSSGRLGFRVLWRKDQGFKMTTRLRARFKLPNLEDRMYVYFGSENEDELIVDQPEAFSRQQQLLSEDRHKDETFFAGLGVDAEDFDFRLGVRGGYKVYLQARYKHAWQWGERHRTELRETAFWAVSKGLGLTTAFDYEYAYSPSIRLRWLNSGTVSTKIDGLGWSSSLGVYKAFEAERLWSLELLINGETGSDIAIADYGIRTKWSQPIYKDWLIGEVIVGHFWPRKNRETEREKSWAFGAGVMMKF